MKMLLITGTDSGIGKTVVTSLLLRNLLDRGLRVDAVKPIETGCPEGANGELQAADATMLACAATGTDSPGRNHVFYTFRNPLAPLMAARMEGREIDRAELVQRLKDRAEQTDLLLVEGAGGVLVPIAENYSYVDLAKECGMSVLVVVGSRLGAGNHSALTFELRKGKGIAVIGYVFNDLFADSVKEDPSIATNRVLVREIGEMYRLPELGYLPQLQTAPIERFWQASESEDVSALANNIVKHFQLAPPNE